MQYGIHPSNKIKELFNKKPYQGADPNKAQIVFIGRDANWDLEIEQNDNFTKVIEYLEDGVAFWQKYKVHHPLKLKCFSGSTKPAGWKYHNMFSKIGINEMDSENISFVELISHPTYGQSNKGWKLYEELLGSSENLNHLKNLDQIIQDDSKLIFIAYGVFKDMQKLVAIENIFNTIRDKDTSYWNQNDFFEFDNINIHTHFSNTISKNTIGKIRTKINEKLNKSIKSPYGYSGDSGPIFQ